MQGVCVPVLDAAGLLGNASVIVGVSASMPATRQQIHHAGCGVNCWTACGASTTAACCTAAGTHAGSSSRTALIGWVYRFQGVGNKLKNGLIFDDLLALLLADSGANGPPCQRADVPVWCCAGRRMTAMLPVATVLAPGCCGRTSAMHV